MLPRPRGLSPNPFAVIYPQRAWAHRPTEGIPPGCFGVRAKPSHEDEGDMKNTLTVVGQIDRGGVVMIKSFQAQKAHDLHTWGRPYQIGTAT